MFVDTKMKFRSTRSPIVCSLSIQRITFAALLFLLLYGVLLWSTVSLVGIRDENHPAPIPKERFFENGSRRSKSNENDEGVITIGIASTITACGSDKFTEGAAVLKYSLDQTSIHGPMGGKYDYKMYIFYHPAARECALPLLDLGFELLERPTPVNVSDIKGEILRERIVRNGCCGEKELIKFEAFRLVEHHVVVHMDLDVIVMKPMDPAIDLMLNPQQAEKNETLLGSFVMWHQNQIPPEIDLMFTKDYNLAPPGRPDKPFQGGFFMIRPSIDIYNEFIDIVLEGDYRDVKKGRGWGGIVGPFHGGMTIQGLLPWYFEHLHPGRAVELNRCVFNNMADNPTTEKTINDVAQGRCRTKEKTCEDCRLRNIHDVATFHFTICLKPWTCTPHARQTIGHRLCHAAHQEWFKFRRDLERSWGRSGIGESSYRVDLFQGNCQHASKGGYIPIRTPYGKP